MPLATLAPAVDPVFADAADEVRARLIEDVGGDVVGEPGDLVHEGDGVATQYFGCQHPGYPGWRWAVTLAHASEGGVTVDEIVLLPGEAAITAPAWVPYRERIQPGDLSPGDILPTDEDDARLVPAYLDGEDAPGDAPVGADDPDDARGLRLVADELGLGRPRVLSQEGRELAADRWYTGDQGPYSPLAEQAHHACRSCGFLVRLAGPLSVTFGVCANEFANDDGRVVALQHGCGAHSQAQLRRKQLPQPLPEPVYDTVGDDELESF